MRLAPVFTLEQRMSAQVRPLAGYSKHAWFKFKSLVREVSKPGPGCSKAD